MTTFLKATSTDEFYNNFPHQPSQIEGQPTYDDLRALRDVLYKNAASIPSSKGGGAHGHLGIVMEPASYAIAVPGQVYTAPLAPALIAYDGLTSAQIAEAARQYAANHKDFQEYNNISSALRRQITRTIEPLYLAPLEDELTGLLGLTLQTIMVWLMTNYGAIMPSELTANRQRLDVPYNPTSEPFQVLTTRVQKARQFATDGGLPISEAEAINASLGALEASGVLERAIESWRDKPLLDRTTWAQFKTHFQQRVLQYQKTRATAGAQYAHQAMQYQRPAEPVVEKFQEWMVTQESNANAVANMAATQTAMIENMVAVQKTLADITAKMNNAGGNPYRPGGNRTYQRREAKDNGSYCHTHGYLIAAHHNSKNCKTCAVGHNKEATRANPMGGNMTGKPT
jgi:hypothetical protein